MALTARALAAAMILAAHPAGAQTVTVEADGTAGYSNYEAGDVAAGSTQLRAFGDLKAGVRFFVEGSWADHNETDSDAFGAAYPYTGEATLMEAYGERLFRPGRAMVGIKAGRYRTPFGIYSRSDYAYSGLSRAPLIRYEGYFALANTFLEQGATVLVGVPQLNVETSLSAPSDVGDVRRASGVDTVTRLQAYYGPVIAGVSYIRTNPYQSPTFARGRAVFTGIDFRVTGRGAQVWGEWLDGQPFDGTSTSGWHVNGSLHRPVMGPVTAVARIEQLDYDTIPRFALHSKRQAVGARIRLPLDLCAQVSVVHQSWPSQAPETAFDMALTYSIRVR
jgi:hypothetical protein